MSPLTIVRGRGVVRVELDRPEAGNPLTPELLDALTGALSNAEQDPDCRVLVLSARGARFCVGTDLSDGAPPATRLQAASSDGEALPYWHLLERLASGPLVTVALVDGTATAGGVGLACACDLVLAGENARFRLTETLVGLVPAMALPFVARRIGEQRAFTAALLTESFDPAAALACGLADRADGPAETMLRQTLVALGRLDRDTAAALKAFRTRLHPRDADLGPDASALLLDRLADAGVRARLDRLADAQVLR